MHVMNGYPAGPLAFAEKAAGPCQTLGPGKGNVLRARDAHGHEYIVKRHASEEKHNREVHACTRWAPALSTRAAHLAASGPDARMILLTALPGQPCGDPGDPRAHHQAGAILRRFHDAEQPRPMPGFQQWLTGRAAGWRARCAPLLSREETRVADRHLTALAAPGTPPGVPRHLDYQPRNWLIDEAGTLRVIDFEHARVSLRARDFTRLHYRYWAAPSDLRDAFPDGYGRPLTRPERRAVRHCGAIDTLTSLVRGTETGDTAMLAHGRATLRQLRQERGSP